jgi:D-alanyl-lipoteichoic acid acyltransferase DltB (MBOAT superfamily)
MTLTSIFLFCLGAALYGWLLPARWRGWVLFVVSIGAIYWLQPALIVYPLEFALPTATLALTISTWYLTVKRPSLTRDDTAALAVAAGMVIVLALAGRVVSGLTPSVPPPPLEVALSVALVAVVFFGLSRAISDKARTIPLFLLAVLALFVALKWEPLTVAFAGWLRGQTGRDPALASVTDVNWLGFSYVAFRLIHALRERQSGKLPDLGLREFLTYALFFPAITAGPIDRAERFVKDLRALDAAESPPRPLLSAARILDGGSRIATGLFKKFVVAALLLPVALSATNATQALTAGGLWLFLYAYAFLLLFDFSGYSDIAIGIGRLYGVTLPENFNRPYFKSSLTTFWQSWHMTLSTWARFYIFNPVSRQMLTMTPKPPVALAVLITQATTMLVIGLWHGFTLNFVIWGLWHALGLWLHKLYTDRMRLFYVGLKERPLLNRAFEGAGVLLTFHYVLLGWVWFALPTPDLSLTVLRRLFGG